jgi:hypothetical protein
MAQDLTVNIKTTSDVPQAMDKAKTATNSFSKQVEDIGKKFGTSFKDIFLSFLGPMALVTGAMALIGKLIADNQKKQEEATQAAIDGTNRLMSEQDKFYARKLDKDKKEKETVEEADTARKAVTEEFLKNDPRGKEISRQYMTGSTGDFYVESMLSNRKDIQDQVQKFIEQDMKDNPPEVEIEAAPEKKAGSFKGPEGFGTVVGVGANPVMEKMTRQNEILEEIKIILQEQSLINRGQMVPSPFTEAVPITMQKIGAV